VRANITMNGRVLNLATFGMSEISEGTSSLEPKIKLKKRGQSLKHDILLVVETILINAICIIACNIMTVHISV
jgi:hypothetical protein